MAASHARDESVPRGGRQGAHGFDADRLRRARGAAGLTQSELAAASGVPLQSVKEYEGGRRIPQVSAVAELARALGISPLELVGRSDSPLTLLSLRMMAGLSQADAGARLGTSRAAYQQLESGRTATLGEHDAEALAAAYDVDPADVRNAQAETRRAYLLSTGPAGSRGRGRRRGPSDPSRSSDGNRPADDPDA